MKEMGKEWRHAGLAPHRSGRWNGRGAAVLSPYMASAQAAARVVVVGGGWGGISAARNLKTLLPAAEVTMVEPKASFMSCPMSVHYIVGQRSEESLTRDYTALTSIGVRHVQVHRRDNRPGGSYRRHRKRTASL
jgi:sulfide dehydrogenase [flavocytochrome c] flavoprotein subunit